MMRLRVAARFGRRFEPPWGVDKHAPRRRHPPGPLGGSHHERFEVQTAGDAGLSCDEAFSPCIAVGESL